MYIYIYFLLFPLFILFLGASTGFIPALSMYNTSLYKFIYTRHDTSYI